MNLDMRMLVDGLLMYFCFIPVLTFHEFAHAWVAEKCGDDTAKLQGRVTLNPAAHIDLIGTIILPLLVVFLSASGGGSLARFIIGWGKPVPVNIANFRHRRRDDTLVALAGPAMNLLLAFGLMLLCRLGHTIDSKMLMEMSVRIAIVSLFLCFFNLLPVPPLDGSHLVKNLIGMSDETYWRLCQYGFIAVILIIQLPVVRQGLALATDGTLLLMARSVRLPI